MPIETGPLRQLTGLTAPPHAQLPLAQDGSVVWHAVQDGESVVIGPEDIGSDPLSDDTPAALGTASPGVATSASRADHVHQLPTIPAASSTLPAALGTAAIGVGTTYARADHVHTLPTIPAASNETPAALGVAAAGASADLSRADHVHTQPSLATLGAATARITTGTAIAASVNTSTLAHDTHYDVSSSSGAVVLTASNTNRTAGDEMLFRVSNIANAITLVASGVTITYYGVNTITTIGDVITLWWRTTTEVVATIVRKL